MGMQDPQRVYLTLLGDFIRVRDMGPDQVDKVLTRRPSNREEYMDAIAREAIIDFDEVEGRGNDKDLSTEDLMEELYAQVVRIHPHLDIYKTELASDSEDPESDSEGGVERGALKRLQHFEKLMGERIIGQDHVFGPLKLAVSGHVHGIRNPKKPVGVYGLIGPTGVGKTETAKAMAEFFFGDELVTIDCSEFQLSHEIAKLIGSPPGYIGHNEGGYLTEALKETGTGVVLFDEIEKAHANVHRILLQVFDEGRLTDSRGFKTDCTDWLFLLTSNVGARDMKGYEDRMGFDRDGRDIPEAVREGTYVTAFKKMFTPEFVGRMDGILVYRPFTEETAARVAQKLLRREGSYFSRGGLKMRFSPAVRMGVAENANYREYAAREMEGIIKTHIRSPLLESLNRGDIGPGDSVTVGYRKGSFGFAYRKGEREQAAGQ